MLMSADLAIISTLPAPQRDGGGQGRHLHPAALPQWRALLELHWQERLERITRLSLAFHQAAETSDASDVDRLVHETVVERRALADIEAALAKLAIGRFGWCAQCGDAIATARLTELPQAMFCARCDP
jgi:DnaK suppressor protein